MNSVSPLNRKASLWAVGLMLFALFFGAGNLIFPAYLGQQAGEAGSLPSTAHCRSTTSDWAGCCPQPSALF